VGDVRASVMLARGNDGDPVIRDHTPRGNQMITVGMNYRVIEGKQPEFEQKFEAVLDALRSAAGHEQSNLFQDVHDQTSYLITSEWSDETAFTDFIHSQAFKEVTAWGTQTILADRPRHRVYRH
jgi:heme-degrading monooxygenase HmoA